MRCTFSLALAIVTAIGLATTAWSQTGGAGASGVAGGAGTASGTGTAAGAGTAGTTGTPRTAGTAGTAGAGNSTEIGAAAAPNGAGTATANGRANVGRNPLSANAGTNPNSTINQTPFFADPGIRRQLNLNNNQFNALNRSYQNAYRQYNQALSNLDRSNLTADQRALRIRQLQNEFFNNFRNTVDNTFTEPRYRTRYEQLQRQYMGFNAFNNLAIQNQLNLTPQQQMQIRKLADSWRDELQRVRPNGESNDITRDQWSRMYSQYWDRLNSILTPEQQQVWSQLTGERYTFPWNMYYLNSPVQTRRTQTANRINPTVPQDNQENARQSSTVR